MRIGEAGSFFADPHLAQHLKTALLVILAGSNEFFNSRGFAEVVNRCPEANGLRIERRSREDEPNLLN